MRALALHLRIAAGRLYAGAFRLGSRLLGIVPGNSWLGRLRRRVAQRARPVPKRKLGFLLAAFARAYPRATFVQIGANDGLLEDPLREFVTAYPWRGVLVEPVPYLFARLRANYPVRDGLVLENVAIATRNGAQPFYYVRESAGEAGVPAWHAGLGSFSRDVVMKHADAIPDLERRLVVAEVPCLTFATLCAKHDVRRLDLLHMDTEGHDYEILKQVDFQRCRPRLLVYEHHHLAAAERAACRAMLTAHGYEALEEGLDVICLNTRDRAPADAPLFAAWDVLRRPGIIQA